MAIVFDGNQLAAELRGQLKQQIKAWQEKQSEPRQIKIAALVFGEDQGGNLYTKKKAEAATEVGIIYKAFFYSVGDEVAKIQAQIQSLNNDESVTGIIIQKPQRRIYQQFWAVKNKSDNREEQTDQQLSFDEWWQRLVGCLEREKDVDGLAPATLQAIERMTWLEEGWVLPATTAAVMKILGHESLVGVIGGEGQKVKMIIIGKSDLLGYPLAAEARRLGYEVELIGRQELQEKLVSGQALIEAQVIVSATGKAGLITGEMIAEGAVLIDVGEPQGDCEWTSCVTKAAFITPVPGGVGPLTVVSLLENALFLARKRL